MKSKSISTTVYWAAEPCHVEAEPSDMQEAWMIRWAWLKGLDLHWDWEWSHEYCWGLGYAGDPVPFTSRCTVRDIIQQLTGMSWLHLLTKNYGYDFRREG